MAVAKGETQSRSDLVATIAANHGVPQTQVDGIVRDYEAHIIKSLAGGGEVRLNGFGNFKVSQRAARMGRNPSTNQPLKIKASKVARFSAAKVMKDAVNGVKASKPAAKAPAKAATKAPAKAAVKAPAKASGKAAVTAAAKTLAKAPAKSAAKKK